MRILLASAVLLSLAVAAMGQEVPKVEVFGGYSYGNVPILSSRTNLNGWNASATVNIYHWFGLTSDFGGLYGGRATQTITLPLGAGTETEQVKENFHTFLFGPQFSYRRGKLVPFGHFLIGESRIGEKFNITCACNAFTIGTPILTPRATSVAAAALGLGVDYGFSKNLAWRIQADELQTSGAASDVRIATGIVFRLGK